MMGLTHISAAVTMVYVCCVTQEPDLVYRYLPKHPLAIKSGELQGYVAFPDRKLPNPPSPECGFRKVFEECRLEFTSRLTDLTQVVVWYTKKGYPVASKQPQVRRMETSDSGESQE